jgi:hypothetical protein
MKTIGMLALALILLSAVAYGQAPPAPATANEPPQLMAGSAAPGKGFSEPLATVFEFCVTYKGQKPLEVGLIVEGPSGPTLYRVSGDRLTDAQVNGQEPVVWHLTFPWSPRAYAYRFVAKDAFSTASLAGGSFWVLPPVFLLIASVVAALILFLVCKYVVFWAALKFIRTRVSGARNFATITFLVAVFITMCWFWYMLTPPILLVCGIIELIAAIVLLRPVK